MTAPYVQEAPDSVPTLKRKIGRPIDNLLTATALAGHLGDWSQTLDIARHPEKFSEGNPILSKLIGKHPSEGKVNTFGALTSMGILGASRIPNTTLRRGMLAGLTAAKIYAMLHNRAGGVSFNLP